MILLISANFPPEPIVSASMTFDLTEALSEKNKVVVLTPRPSRPLGFIFPHETGPKGKFEHVILNSFVYPKSYLHGRALENYSFGRHATNFIARYHSSIKCCYVNVWPLISQYMIIRILMHYSIPSVTHIQDIYPESLTNRLPLLRSILGKILIPFDKFILNNSTRIIANSFFMKKVFVETRGISEFKIEVVQNWRDEHKFFADKVVPENLGFSNSKLKPFTFMFLGNIGPVAGVDFIIRCFDEAKLNETKLVIAGCGSEKERCEKLAESLNNSNIHFRNVPDGKVFEVQKEADVMLLPVKKGAGMSSIPSKLQAYMFSGKPVIACVDEKSETSSTIMHCRCGWVIPPENPDILINTMRHVLSQPGSHLQELGINGLKYANENYSRVTNLTKIVSLITDTMRI
jgi:glycosyltransferase involved in cell wall biosynthesis